MSLIYVSFKSPVSLVETVPSWDVKKNPRVSAEVVAGGVDFQLPQRRRCHVPSENIAYLIFAEAELPPVVEDVTEAAARAAHQRSVEGAGNLGVFPLDMPSVPDPNTTKPEPPPLNRGQVLGKLGVYDPKTGALDKPCPACGGVAMPIRWAKSHGIEGTAQHELADGTVGCKGTVREFLARVS